jgi:hypothetical protein
MSIHWSNFRDWRNAAMPGAALLVIACTCAVPVASAQTSTWRDTLRDMQQRQAAPGADVSVSTSARAGGAGPADPAAAAMAAATEDAARRQRLDSIEAALPAAHSEKDMAILNARAQIENGKMLSELVRLQAARGAGGAPGADGQAADTSGDASLMGAPPPSAGEP